MPNQVFLQTTWRDDFTQIKKNDKERYVSNDKFKYPTVVILCCRVTERYE